MQNRKSNRVLRGFGKAKGLKSVLVVTAMFLHLGSAFGQADGERQFGSKAGQKVNEAQELAESEQYGAALGKLDEALKMSDISPYEISTIHTVAGEYYYNQDNLDQAISALEKALQAGGLLSAEANTIEGRIAKLLIANEQFGQGAQRLESWVKATGNQDPQNTQYIMQAWIQAERYQKALPWAEEWFNKTADKQRSDFDLMNFLYHNLGLQGRQTEIVKQMIDKWPEDKELWNSWISLLANNGREKEAFQIKNVMYQWGMLSTEEDIKKIVEYHQYYEMPYQAAEILEYEIDAGRVKSDSRNLVRLSELFRQAREYERALPILKQAAEKSGRPKSWAGYGEALYHQGQCEEADIAFKKAMELGYDRGKSWMLMANCQYELGQAERRPACDGPDIKNAADNAKLAFNNHALQYFRKVPVTSKVYGDSQKWVDFVTNENQSYAELCQEIHQIEVDSCMIKIEAAVELQVIRGDFFLKEEDQHCMAYIDEYERRYGEIPSLE